MIDKAAIDPNALHFYRMLKEAGFSAYFVGGSVRDLLLGKHPKDFDIATNATPQQIKRVIPQGRIIGRRFRHVMLERSGGRYEIVTFRGPVVQAEEEIAELDDEPLEDHPASVSEEAAAAPAPSGNERGGRDGRDRERRYPDLNQFGNAEQDALRRDFTINALFYDPDADELVDYVEGKLDIDRRIVRSIGDPMTRMEEDPIRILRAIRHKMKLGLEYDPALENAMREHSPLLVETSKDRIREEFLKVCNDHSLSTFLSEGRRLGLVPHIMPWFENISDSDWDANIRLLEKFKASPIPERHSADMGLALMMVPLVHPLVLEPYRQTLQPGDKNHLPDMKYFLSCEPLRNFYLRNLRISRAQTDHLVRALFYFNRMTGLWLEQGPPRRIIGRLFQHPPAVLAAKMARLALDVDGKAIPDWMQELADYDPAKRRRQRDEQRDHGRRGPSREDDQGDDSGDDSERDEMEAGESGGDGGEGGEAQERSPRRRDRNEREGRDSFEGRENTKITRLPPPDQPMVWNGPLHAPVLRPVFNEEATTRWARKNQTVRAFRPSGIPNQPVDHSLLKSESVYNYKPEIEGSGGNAGGGGGNRADEEGGDRGGRGRRGGRDRDRDRGRRGGRDRDRGGDRGGERPARAEGRDRGDRGNRDDGRDRNRDRNRGGENRGNERPSRPEPVGGSQPIQADEYVGNRRPQVDEDSIGNIRRPGEPPAALYHLSNNQQNFNDLDEDEDDNIGNRLDAPPTSGHVGLNGEGFVGPQRNQGYQQGRGRPGGGGEGGNRNRRGRRRGRRGGGGGGGGGNRPPRGPQNVQ